MYVALIILAIVLTVMAYVFMGTFTLKFMATEAELARPDASGVIMFGLCLLALHTVRHGWLVSRLWNQMVVYSQPHTLVKENRSVPQRRYPAD